MATRTSKLARTVAEIVETDRRVAAARGEDAAEAALIDLAPLSYAELYAVRGTPRLAELLATVPAELLRAQAVRFLVERKAAHGTPWTWEDVADVAARFARCVAKATEAAAQARYDAASAVLRDAAALARVGYQAAQAEAQAAGAAYWQAHDARVAAERQAPTTPVIATLPATSPVLVDEVLARRQREALAERDRAVLAGDAEAARFAKGRADAVARARRYLARAVASGTTLVQQLPAGDWQVLGSQGTPYTLIIGEGLRLECSCDHGARLRAGLTAAGVCWHGELIAACEEAGEWEIGADELEGAEYEIAA